MPYCSSAEKFTGYEELEIEEQSIEVSDDYEVMASVGIARPCAFCGQEAATTELEIVTSFEHDCPGPGADNANLMDGEEQFELEGVEYEPVDEYKTKDRHGKPITRARYQKHLLGCEATFTIRCNVCNETFDVVASESVPASAFDVEASH